VSSEGTYICKHSWVAVLLDYLAYGLADTRMEDGRLVFEFIDHDGEAAEHESQFWTGAAVADAKHLLESNSRVMREIYHAKKQANNQEEEWLLTHSRTITEKL
jgi:hypothetical protein